MRSDREPNDAKVGDGGEREVAAAIPQSAAGSPEAALDAESSATSAPLAAGPGADLQGLAIRISEDAEHRSYQGLAGYSSASTETADYTRSAEQRTEPWESGAAWPAPLTEPGSPDRAPMDPEMTGPPPPSPEVPRAPG